MMDFLKKLNHFRDKLIETPNIAIIVVYITNIFILYILSLRVYLSSLISPYLFSLILDFIILMVVYAFFAFYLIPFVLCLPNGKQTFSEFLEMLKMTKRSLSIKFFLLGLVIGTFLLIGSFFTRLILGELFIYVIDFNQILSFPSSMTLGFFNLIYHISPALWEEVIFRGVILTLLLKLCSTRKAIIIDGILFGVFHWLNFTPETGLYITLGQVIYTTCSGITLAYMYVKTSNLIPCILAHYMNNIISALIVTLTSEMQLPAFFTYIGLTSFITMAFGLGAIKLYEKLIMKM